jgi:hypothetical protein
MSEPQDSLTSRAIHCDGSGSDGCRLLGSYQRFNMTARGCSAYEAWLKHITCRTTLPASGASISSSMKQRVFYTIVLRFPHA